MTPTILYISTHHNDRSVGLAVRSRRNMPVLTMVLWIIITFLRAASTYCCLEDWWPAPSGRPTLTTQSTPRRCRTDASSQPSISTINLAPTTTLLFIINLPFTSAPLPYASSSTSPLHLSTSQGAVLPSLPVTSRYHPSTTTHTHELASVVVFSPASLHHEPSPDHRRSPAGPGRDRPGRGQHGVVAASYQ